MNKLYNINRVSSLLEISKSLFEQYDEKIFDCEDKHPGMLNQIIRHEAYDQFNINDLTSIEIGFIKKQIKIYTK